MNFKDRVAIVTGAASGIGRATAIQLAKKNADVIIADLNIEEAKELEKFLKDNYNGQFQAKKLDVSRKDRVDEFVSEVIEKFKKIDILVHCAGIAHFGEDFIDLKEESWDRVIDINLKGTFLMGQRVMKEMKKNKYGRIVNIGSIAGEVGSVLSGANYAASKGGVHALTKTMAKYGAKYNITANCIAPGQINTRMVSIWNNEERKIFSDKIPLGRFGEPEEAASAILYLASDEASFITGVVLDVNGGILMA